MTVRLALLAVQVFRVFQRTHRNKTESKQYGAYRSTFSDNLVEHANVQMFVIAVIGFFTTSVKYIHYPKRISIFPVV